MVWTPSTRAEHDRSRLSFASDLTDKEWALIAPFMPGQPARGTKRKTCLRRVVEAVFYLLQTGCQWAMLPKDFPPRSTVNGYFKRFEGDGTWDRIMTALHERVREKDGRNGQPSYAIIDSQSSKTGPNARDETGFDAGKKVKGRKRHIIVDTLGFILRAEVHSASVQDRDGAARVFKKLINYFPFVKRICGDGGYAGPIAQSHAPRPLDIIKRNQAGFEVLPKRWIVERTFAWLGINRRLSMDHERYAATTLTFMRLAMIKLCVRRLARS